MVAMKKQKHLEVKMNVHRDVVVNQNIKEESSSSSRRSCSCMSLSAATRKGGNKWKGSSFYNRCVNKILFYYWK